MLRSSSILGLSKLLYGMECWTAKNQHENKISVTETIECAVKLNEIKLVMAILVALYSRKKFVENICKWCGHIKGRPVDLVVKRVDQMEIIKSVGAEENLKTI